MNTEKPKIGGEQPASILAVDDVSANLQVLTGMLNSLMCRSGIADRFVTLVAAVLDQGNHTVTLVNAGHPSPQLYHRATGRLGVPKQ